MEPLVALILGQDGMAARLIAEHIDDGNGRCRACPLGGQRGHQRWPCALVISARAADTQVRPGTVERHGWSVRPGTDRPRRVTPARTA